MAQSGEVATLWKVLFFRDRHGREPVRRFFLEAGLTDGEKRQLAVRIEYLARRGLQLVVERADILDEIQTEAELYELRLDNTPNNPRILLCGATGRQKVLLQAFKKKGRRHPTREVEIAKRRRSEWLAGQGVDS